MPCNLPPPHPHHDNEPEYGEYVGPPTTMTDVLAILPMDHVMVTVDPTMGVVAVILEKEDMELPPTICLNLKGAMSLVIALQQSIRELAQMPPLPRA